ncbi:hypothetical protein BDV29DRAFT_153040 [Aspergillus leporis]|uniref:Uncharacterized protein n=1 Tax=Aspergillus leporis TaxID=41062 RepID=A0A5N5XDH3_9EURO|nr:hypothetical protein BDV29DRAFT_153040 [Aspergillus leporis]
MKISAILITAMGLLARPGIGSPVPDSSEGSDIEPQACVAIKVFQEFDFKGASYSECLAPKKFHEIRTGFRKNAGSFAVNTKGYVCTPGTPDHRSCKGAVFPGLKRLPNWCVNNIGNYYCTFTN